MHVFWGLIFYFIINSPFYLFRLLDKLKELVLEDFKNLQEILNNIPKEEIKNIQIKENDKLNSKHITKKVENEFIKKIVDRIKIWCINDFNFHF